jgi:hypothetical protein
MAATIKDALTALWEASDQVCGKRLKVMIPALLPALERNGRLKPSFKLKEKRREGAQVIKCYYAPSTPCERALAHAKVPVAVKQRLREPYRTLDPVALLAEIRAAQDELGRRIDRRAGKDTTL